MSNIKNRVDKEDLCKREDTLIFRYYEEGDELGIIELMKPYWRHLNSDKAREFWKWEYKSNPNGRSLIMLAEHEGKIIGHYAMLPMKIRCGRTIVNGGKAEGSVVHPEYRGNIAPRFFKKEKDVRLFEILIHNLFETAEKENVGLIFGFPNEVALKPQIRAGYRYMPVPCTFMVLPIDNDKAFHYLFSKKRFKAFFIFAFKLYYKVITTAVGILCKNSKTDRFWERYRAENKVLIREISESDLDEKIDNFWGKYCIENNCITIERSQKYIEWRFIQNPVIPHKVFVCERNGEITAMVVINILLPDYPVANIVDIVGLKKYEDDLHFLLSRTIQILKENGVVIIKTWLSKNEQSKKYIRILRKCKFCPLPIKCSLHLIVKILNSNLKEDYINDINNWYITMAFTEGVS